MNAPPAPARSGHPIHTNFSVFSSAPLELRWEQTVHSFLAQVPVSNRRHAAVVILSWTKSFLNLNADLLPTDDEVQVSAEKLRQRQRYKKNRPKILADWAIYYAENRALIAQRRRERYYKARGLLVPEVPTPRFGKRLGASTVEG